MRAPCLCVAAKLALLFSSVTLLHTGCASTVREVDRSLEQRLAQAESAVTTLRREALQDAKDTASQIRRETLAEVQEALRQARTETLAEVKATVGSVKSEAIAEAKDAAADLLAGATVKLEAAAKEVIQSAAQEVQKVVDRSTERVEKIVDEQRSKATQDLKDTLRNDVPTAIEQSVVRSADKIAERLGVEKKTVPGPGGVPMEVWVLGGTGLAGAIGTYGKTIWRWMNRRKRDEEDDEWLEKKLAEREGKKTCRCGEGKDA